MSAPLLRPVLVPTPPCSGEGRERVEVQRTAARGALADSAGASGAELGNLETDERGAPLPSNGWHWSLTHDASWSAAVVAPGPVGIDLERISPRREQLVKRVLDDQELRLLDEETTLAFIRAWTAKEAVLKAAGVGLLELSSCRVVGRPDDRHLLLEHRSRQQLVRHWEHGQSLLALTVSTLDQEVSWQGLGAMEATR